jgi:5-methylcytosine-specific restriction enzyme A
MPSRAKSICKKIGCNTLIDRPGYCPVHAIFEKEDTRNRFDVIDSKKTSEQKKFYSSSLWTSVSRRHRVNEPLCRRCRRAGKIVAGALVHHNPPLDELIKKGLSPFDENYLETLCLPCHQKELSLKRNP